MVGGVVAAGGGARAGAAGVVKGFVPTLPSSNIIILLINFCGYKTPPVTADPRPPPPTTNQRKADEIGDSHTIRPDPSTLTPRLGRWFVLGNHHRLRTTDT